MKVVGLNQGLSLLVDSVQSLMTNGQMGTDSTLFVKTQTGLQTPVAATNVALADKTFSSRSISVTHFLDTSTGNGNTYTEHEINDGTDSFNRAVKAGIAKTSGNESSIITTFNFELIP